MPARGRGPRSRPSLEQHFKDPGRLVQKTVLSFEKFNMLSGLNLKIAIIKLVRKEDKDNEELYPMQYEEESLMLLILFILDARHLF